MSKRRDRHGRGLRGPLSLPNSLTGTPMPLRLRSSKVEFFTACIRSSVTQINQDCPRALFGIDIGFEDVPSTSGGWQSDRVPLAAAIGARPSEHGQIVLFRRPIEHRATGRKGLRILVHRTIVEQLSAVTGIGTDELDPRGLAGEDDWD